MSDKLARREIVINKDDILAPGEVIGTSLVSDARQSYQNDKRIMAVCAVKHLLSVRDKAKTMISRWNDVVEFNQKKIDALEEGKFNLEIHTGIIVFDDNNLNILWEVPEALK